DTRPTNNYHMSELVKLIIRRRDLKSYRDDYDSTDIIAEAIAKLLEIRKRITRNLTISVPVNPPTFPKDLGLPTTYRYNFYRSMVQGVMKKVLPLLRGDFEKYRAKPGWTSPLLKEFFAKHGYKRGDDDYEHDSCEVQILDKITDDWDSFDEQF